MQKLSKADVGQHTIKWMFGLPEILSQMRYMDIQEGSTIQVVSKSWDGLLIRSGSRCLAIGNEVAERIQV